MDSLRRLFACVEDDLLALGTLLYGMATGVAPYGAAGSSGNRRETPSSPIEYNPRLPSGLVRLFCDGFAPMANRSRELAAHRECRCRNPLDRKPRIELARSLQRLVGLPRHDVVRRFRPHQMCQSQISMRSREFCIPLQALLQR